MNSVDGYNFGDVKIHFYKTKNTIALLSPSGRLEGTSWGDHSFNLTEKLLAHDLDNDLFCEAKFNPDQKSAFSLTKQKTSIDYFKGGIYKINQALK